MMGPASRADGHLTALASSMNAHRIKAIPPICMYRRRFRCYVGASAGAGAGIAAAERKASEKDGGAADTGTDESSLRLLELGTVGIGGATR